MKKIAVLVISIILLIACTKDPIKEEESLNHNSEIAEKELELPIKSNPNSVLMSESPITPINIDNYLFRDDCVYIDLRDPNQFYLEGSIAGFINIPFYGYIANFNFDENALYTMTKNVEGDEQILLGSVGSFVANYLESDLLIKDIVPRDKKIIVISTAGVEASYFISLLIQLGYDGSNLYNAGSFSNGISGVPAYRLYEGAKYLVKPNPLYDTNIKYTWSIDFTRVEED